MLRGYLGSLENYFERLNVPSEQLRYKQVWLVLMAATIVNGGNDSAGQAAMVAMIWQ